MAMLKWQWTGALAALTAAFALAGSEAEAGHRQRFHYVPFYGFYEPGPEWAPPPRYYYYFDEPEPGRFYDYDEGYYEPKYQGPDEGPVPQKPQKKRKPAVSVPDAEKKKSVAKATTSEVQPKSSAMSCDRATAIVTGYGFGTVKVEDCQGQVYAFNAKRDGKTYAIKLSAVSGELTEVKKLQ
jgi:hypothetical protein